MRFERDASGLLVPRERRQLMPVHARGPLTMAAPQQMLMCYGVGDPNFSSVQLLLHMNGTNGSTTFTDVKGHTVLASASAQISTAQSKFGGASGLFAGTGTNTAGDYITTNAYGAFTGGSGDWTYEFWLRLTSLPPSSAVLIDGRPAGTVGKYISIYVTSAGVLTYHTDSVDRITSSALSTATWYHIAVCKASGSTRMFVTGTQAGSTFTDSITYADTRFVIGSSGYHTSPQGQYGLNGNLDDLRYTVGVGRYTANFTAPSAQFPDS